MTSLRARLVAWFSALVISAGLIGGAIAYWAARVEPEAFLDDQLRQVATTIANVERHAAQSDADPALDPDDAIVVQVWDSEGRAVVAPANDSIPRQTATGLRTINSPDGPWRTFTLVEKDRTTQISQQAQVRHELAVGTAWSALLPMTLLVPLSWLLVRWLVGRILRPVDGVAAELRNRRADAGSALAIDALPDEIRPLVTAMNGALDRLGRALDANRRFVSDAAHQLRTPLTALRLQVQNLERRASPENADLIADIRSGLLRMTELTTQLLALARAEAAPSTPSKANADLAATLREAVDGVRPLAEDRRIALSCDVPERLTAVGDQRSLVVLFSNLLDNAVRYTPVGGAVDVTVTDDPGFLIVKVTDSGPGLPPEALEHVFDRFYRHEAKDSAGSGLGLPIARAIAARSHATVSLGNRTDRSGLVATVLVQRLS